MMLKLAWRNTFRNRRRTILTGLAIAIGLAVMIQVDGMFLGLDETLIRSGTDVFLGHGQIHRRGFRETLEEGRTIRHSAALSRALAQEPIIRSVTRRTRSFGMLSSPTGASSVILFGIEPDRERTISAISRAINRGRFLPDQPGQILIGTRLAETLQVQVGDKVVLTVAEAASGALAQDLFRVAGMFNLDIPEMDGRMAFIPLRQAQRLLNLGEGVHEIAFDFHDFRCAEDSSLPFWQKFSRDDNVAQGWPALLPDLDAFVGITAAYIRAAALIAAGIIAVSILNMLFMSLYERMAEFGLLRALGTRPGGLMGLIIAEAGVLAALSVLLGVVIGGVAAGLLAKFGLELPGTAIAGIIMNQRCFPVVEARQFVVYPGLFFAWTLFLGLYPAFHAARVRPAQVMNR